MSESICRNAHQRLLKDLQQQLSVRNGKAVRRTSLRLSKLRLRYLREHKRSSE